MAKRRRQARRSTTTATTRPLAALRPVAWSAVVGAAFAVVVAAPAHGDPVGVPDAGTRPAPAGELRLPGAPPSGPPVVAPVPGPLAAEVMAAETEVGSLGEQLKDLNEQLATARAAREEAERGWREAADRLSELRAALESAAEEAYKAAAVYEPFQPFGPALRDFGRLMPRTTGAEEPETTPWDLARAEEDERDKFRVYTDRLLVEQGLAGQQVTLQTRFEQRQAALIKLKQDNATQLARIEAERDAYERSLAQRYGKAGINVVGEAAHPNALRAVQFALAQLGKPYEWGAEGPNRYDCSGLMYASYKSVGVTLQRVAKDQYRTTTPVPIDKLLPGDLVFFATDLRDPATIHHVGMYIGDDKMVHAPSTGDVVKISSVWRSRLFGATRVLPAVAAPQTSTPATTRPPTTPPATTPPATTPPATTPPATTPPATTPPPSETPSPTPPPPSPSSAPPSSPSSAPSTTTSSAAPTTSSSSSTSEPSSSPSPADSAEPSESPTSAAVSASPTPT